MSLENYRRKRNNFTPEPIDTREKATCSAPIFVVQKHVASSLHFDFRLEYKGVLLSWAVPKGIPAAGERHLAKKVEDHPFAYKDFEGVIPEGSYGAGGVIVWDQGYYITGDNIGKGSVEIEIEKGLQNGHFSFTLVGKKTNGHFALIKLSGKESDWLFIKGKEDEKNKDRKNIGEESVLSGLTIEDVCYGKNAPMPHQIKPMMAYTAPEAFDREGWFFEIKWDGYRTIAEIDDNKVNLHSRNLKSYNQKFMEITSELSSVNQSMILDGEIVVVDKDGKPDFQALQDYSKTKSGNLIYYIFDLLYLNGRNLMGLPLFRRRELLKEFFPRGKKLKFSDHIENNGKAFYKAVIANGIEGIMAKDGNSLYIAAIRSESWLKIKRESTTEAIIVGYTLPQSGRKYFSALVLAAYNRKGELEFIGHVGTGFDDRKLKDLSEKFKTLIGETPFETIPKLNAPAVWLKPILVCSVKFSEWTRENVMRQPIFLNLRDDIDPKEVILNEQY